ncbi:uncharacterized protein LOC134209174 [Armigeres subalbatus]|uniref:uncharacterized protein LOC134209174 n=1 Tax=Armigeres subalbatus TaxID=124917 RepID=UPI002ED1EC1C
MNKDFYADVLKTMRSALDFGKEDCEVATRIYREKIAMCYGVNPSTLKTTPQEVPLTITFASIYQFLVEHPNPFTGQPKDCAKDMEAILYYKNEWVKSVSGKKVHDVYAVHGSVRHSFALNEKPLTPWILISESGRILAAHCNCAIGLFECCSHIGATLFALEGIRTSILEKKEITDLPAYWKKPPTSISENLYKKVRDIDFGKQIQRAYYATTPSTSTNYDFICRNLLSSLQMDGINVASTTLFCGEKQMAFSCTICTHESELKNDLKNYNFQLLYDPLNKSTIEQLQKVAAEFIRNFTSDPDLLMKIDKLTADQSDSKWNGMFSEVGVSRLQT